MGEKPLFPGDDYIKQMTLMFKTLGTPSDEDMKSITNDKALDFIKTLKKQPKTPFIKLFPNANPLALDLLEKMLVFNPQHRISVDDALRHPYFKNLHNSKTETVCKTPFDFEFENVEMTKDLLRELVWDEVLNFRPSMKSRRDKFVENVRAHQAAKHADKHHKPANKPS